MNQVDDIILKGPNSKKKPKRKGKGILVILFLLFLILAGLCGAYWYYTTYMLETSKTMFIKYVGQTNFDNIFNIDIYYTMLEKINTQSFETSTTSDLTTTIENEYTENLDVSKLAFNLNIISDKENEGMFFDGNIDYSSNNLFNIKLISDKNNIGIGSVEILDKYIATAKTEYTNSIQKATGASPSVSIDIISETINNITENKIVLEDKYKTEKIQEYSNLIFDLIPEESVTEKENVIVTIDSQTVNTNAYTLSLDTNKYKEILSKLLTTLKNDEELISNIVTGEEVEAGEETNTVNSLTNVQVDYSSGENEEFQTSEEIIVDDSEMQLTDNVPDTTLVNENETEFEVIEEVPDDTLVKTEGENDTNLFYKLLAVFLFNQKIEGTAENLINEISEELSNVENLKEGIKITVYVKNEEEKEQETVKLVADLPNNISIDIEYQEESKVKITYLEETEENVSSGSSIEIERVASDVSTTFDIKLCNIENTKVTQKTEIDIKTEGSITSKGYTTEAIVKYTDSEGDLKINIENQLDFKDVSISETLTEENAIFVDRLTEEEATALYTQISDKISQVIDEKFISLDFIENNSTSSVVQQQEENIEEKDEIKQKLIETVSKMMGEAQNNGETFTIQNLSNLEIEGYSVSCIITETLATVKINGYTFTIDSNFVLSE